MENSQLSIVRFVEEGNLLLNEFQVGRERGHFPLLFVRRTSGQAQYLLRHSSWSGAAERAALQLEAGVTLQRARFLPASLEVGVRIGSVGLGP